MKVILALSLFLFSATAFADVTRAVLTTEMDSNAQPVSNLSAVDNTVGTVLFYTEITGMRGVAVAHRWSYDSRVIATVNMNIRAQSAKTWSTASINPKHTGRWTVEVINPATNEILASKTFVVTSPKNRSIKQRVAQQYAGGCESRIFELQEQLKENPDSTYLNFLLKQQKSRCK